MKYFHLHFFCKYIEGASSGCIYNMKTHEMISIGKKNKSIISNCHENIPVLVEQENFLDELIKKGLGTYYEAPIYIEEMRYGAHAAMKKVIYPNLFVKRVFVQITNECNLSCCYCNPNGKTLRKTGCKKWNNIDRFPDERKWKQILNELRNVSCEEIEFIGGNPLIEKQRLVSLIKLADEMGYNKISIHTNLFGRLDEELLEVLRDYKVKLIWQLFSLNKETLEKFSENNLDEKELISNVERVLAMGIEVNAQVLYSIFNEDEIEFMAKWLQDHSINGKCDFVHDLDGNSYYSSKYVDKLYDRSMGFGIVTKESISFLEGYNSCLYGQISINLSGDITPCPMMNDVILGNIHENHLVDILNSDLYKYVTELSRGKVEGCGYCAYKNNCYDCRAIEYAATGKLDGQKYCKFLSEVKN